jgi:hypothetical protein
MTSVIAKKISPKFQLIRIYDRDEQAFLHLSTKGYVKDELYAWSGTKAQAQRLLNHRPAQFQNCRFTYVREIPKAAPNQI